MTDTEAQILINKVEKRLFGLKSDNYLGYQVRYHLDIFKETGKHAQVLQHYLNHTPLYLQHKVFYYNGMIIDRRDFKTVMYSKINRHNEWRPVRRLAKNSLY